MEFTVKIEGLDRLDRNSKQIPSRARTEIEKALFVSGKKVEGDAKRSILEGQKSGILYKRRTVVHRASAPGEAPASDTGRLVNSINTTLGATALEAIVSAGGGIVRYARALEFGTAKMGRVRSCSRRWRRTRPGSSEGYRRRCAARSAAGREGPWKLAIAPQIDAFDKTTAEDSKTNPRLYNLDTDIGETTNVAEKHPEVVKKLQALATKMNDEIGGPKPKARRPAGVVADPKPLYPLDEPPPAKPAELDKLKPGDAVPTTAAPQIGGKAFTLSCQVETELRDTIILAHGGNAAGCALHLKEGRVVFAVRTAKDGLTEIQSEPIKGAVRVTAKLAEDGTMTLTVGDAKAVTGKARGVIPRQPAEDFCLGHDNGQPVANYSKGKQFVGKITELKVTIP